MSKLAEIIAGEIKERGIIPFARFMELALYCPEYGFYEAEKDRIGANGDYFTSVSVGPLFGELLAFQFAEWFEEETVSHQEDPGGTDAGNRPLIRRREEAKVGQAPAPSPLQGEKENRRPIIECKNAAGPIRRESGLKFQIVEAGAHDGRLARDILAWLQASRPGVFSRLQYYIIEPSLRRQEWQRDTLADFEPHVKWSANLAAVSHSPSPALPQSIYRIIFCNELLDALPVHRFGWDAKAKSWFEWGVGHKDGQFTWQRMDDRGQKAEVRGQIIPQLSPELLNVLPEGFAIEVCPAAAQWWGEAANILSAGKLIAFDYGLTAEEFFAAGRKHGTLRAYRAHQVTDELLRDPGQQDLTGHVNFSALQKVGEAAGLDTENFTTQERFLSQIAERCWKREGTWDSKRIRQFQSLVHPNLMGKSFSVLVQSNSLIRVH